MNDSSVLLNGDLLEPAQVHQAAGMLTVQLGIPIIAALARRRAHAATTHRPLIDIAREVITGRLHLTRPPDAPV